MGTCCCTLAGTKACDTCGNNINIVQDLTQCSDEWPYTVIKPFSKRIKYSLVEFEDGEGI